MSKTRRIVLPAPMDHQKAALDSQARIKVLACGRRWGKTILGMISCIIGHGEGKWKGALNGGDIWWVAPNYTIAQHIWRLLKVALRDA